MAKLKTRTNQPVTDSEGLLDHIAQNGITTEVGGDLYVDGTINTGGGVEIADNLVVGTTADIHTITANQNLNIRTTNDIVLQGSNTSISLGEEIEFDNVPTLDTDFTNFHFFDIYSAFGFRVMTEEEKTQYGVESDGIYYITTTYTQKQVVERILKERLHLLRCFETNASSYNYIAIYNIGVYSPEATDGSPYFSLFYNSLIFGKAELIMFKRLDNVAFFEYIEE